ncbi:MAG TPA: DUF4147 domain-containing protein [Thermoanaerobaculia bacterium]|nr:DUF4147 domain-containing protein [Thermoanaerobaculia bacterium]
MNPSHPRDNALAALEQIYRQSLAACAPERLVRQCAKRLPDRACVVVALGKCAAGLIEGFAAERRIERAFAAVPFGYRRNIAVSCPIEIEIGGHPEITPASFAAGRALLRFVDAAAESDVVFLISGGSSACVELPLAPWFDEAALAIANRILVDSGIPIGEINTVRKHLSAIKGGRLGSRMRHSFVTLVYSDVSTGALADVGSGPTLADPTSKDAAIELLLAVGDARCEPIAERLSEASCPETPKTLAWNDATLIADNTTLTSTAAVIASSLGFSPIQWDGQIETDVAVAARDLAERAVRLGENEILIAGGEPTVARHGDGRGGRCSELAVRFFMEGRGKRDKGREEACDLPLVPRLSSLVPLTALFASSDGVDGSSGAAGVMVSTARAQEMDVDAVRRELRGSNSMAVAERIGEAIIIPPTGNNLRDLFLLARG